MYPIDPTFVKPPNKTWHGDGFYISFNTDDYFVYGAITTALVWLRQGHAEAFYVLNGNHVDAYKAIMAQGWEACFAYFNEHIDEANKYSDKGAPEEVYRKWIEAVSKLR